MLMTYPEFHIRIVATSSSHIPIQVSVSEQHSAINCVNDGVSFHNRNDPLACIVHRLHGLNLKPIEPPRLWGVCTKRRGADKRLHGLICIGCSAYKN